MLDLTALARRLAGRPGGQVVLDHAHRVRIGECCTQRCPGCRALPTVPQFDPMVVRHALRTLGPDAGRVLLAGADPLACDVLFEAIGLARALGMAVEILTPGPITASQALALRAAGVERVRVTMDSHSPGRLDRIRSAAVTTRVGLACDLQIALRSGQSFAAFEELLDEATMLPVGRVVVSTRGCRLAEEAADQQQLTRAARSMVQRAFSATPPEAALCLDGAGLHVRMVVDAIEAQFGDAIAARAGQWMAAGRATPRFATARG